MVTYAIFKDEKNKDVVTIISLTKEVEELMDKRDFDYITAVIEIASLVDTQYIISDESDEKIMLMFPNATIIDHRGGDVH